MKLYFEKRVVVGFIIALAIIIWLGVHSFLYNQKFVETSKWVSHTNEVLFHSEQILTTVTDMEADQRGYVITKNDLFLESLPIAIDTLNDHLNNLTILIRDNADQLERLGLLRQTVSEKVSFIKNVITARAIGFEAALDSIQSLKGIQLMKEVRKIISEMQLEEKKLLQKRIRANEENFKDYNLAFIELLSTTVLILILVFTAIHFNLKARVKAETDLQTASSEIKDLYENAPCGYHSLNAEGIFVDMNTTMLSWLGYVKSQVVGKLKLQDIVTPQSLKIFQDNFPVFKKQGSVKNLEFNFIRSDGTTFPAILSSTAIVDASGNYIKSRSTIFDITDRKRTESKVIQLHKEMESFTYSVSHDLRAPLRSIDGYAKILEEDYANQVDEEGKRTIGVIMSNARHMGKLIDGLLDFSRIGQRELVRSECDMDHLVRSIVKEVEDPKRDVAISVQTLLPCMADLSMIRQVWENLIANALKFTAKTKTPAIEIGSYAEKNQHVYYVKDNGIGFDMQYVHKLFGVFQRLHKVQDFEGTGVGLAIVHRIITKHDGTIWADAKLNGGATFFFSLSYENN